MSRQSTTARRALDAKFLAVRTEAANNPPPPRGWVRAIREALGMSREDLARRLGVTRQAVLQTEQAESTGAITLSKLREIAAALECDVYYSLVPRRPLDDVVNDRARRLAEERLGRIEHTMRLEDQLSERSDRDLLIDDLAREIADSRALWRD
ncbi:MAG TPA: mobile mystery protein A [Gaiellaceae bacterium]